MSAGGPVAKIGLLRKEREKATIREGPCASGIPPSVHTAYLSTTFLLCPSFSLLALIMCIDVGSVIQIVLSMKRRK